ncbi:hypothetical protein ACHAWF_017777 [Thalassiosira exigua]
MFLVLDDLNLLYTETGKRNDSIHPRNFLCTVSYVGSRRVVGEVGLTKERMETAFRRILEQVEARERRRGDIAGTGDWTEEEWAILSAREELRPHLSTLWLGECPPWIAEVARRHVDDVRRRDGDVAKKRGGLFGRRRRG